ncbi:MAG: glycosyltransferase family 39 protein [bacterium]
MNSLEKSYNYIKDFTEKYKLFLLVFILLMAILIRLIKINSPLADHHCWRQTDTAAIARNFYRNGFRLLYPQIDWGGASKGYVESEFQIYPFIVALLYKVFGLHEVIGRLISVLFFVGSMLLIYFLAKEFYDEKVALMSAFIFSVLPMNIYFSRTFMPESMMIFCSIGLIYYFYKWITYQKGIDFLLAAILGALAFLIKIPTLYLGFPLLYLSWKKYGIRFICNKKLWLFFSLIIIPPILWYAHAHSLLKQYGLSFGIWDIGQDKWGNWGIWIKGDFYRTLYDRLRKPVLTAPGFFIFIFGLILGIKDEKQNVLRYWLLGIVVYFFLIARGNMVHDYYQLPIIPVASIIIAAGINILLKKHIIIINQVKINPYIVSSIAFLLLVVFIPFEGYKRCRKNYRTNQTIYEAGNAIKGNTPEGSLIISSDDGIHNPEIFYLGDRKGWHVGLNNESSLIQKYIGEGAGYFIASFEEISNNTEKFIRENPLGRYLEQNFSVLISNERFVIFKLTR